ncbi:MAG: hypothetical protein QG574_2072 [Cyanobacteriota bacterium erpe_2018_sw_21hr_WHONDRS-SW48-000092_B_bin.40]|nr:hypothetical protein [Cyanobacteriota bacterium erpe_2018_sw_21hr_WHONDRS-SW48-000092_B_bin.40]
MSDAEYRLLIQRSFDEELSKQEHRAFVNHLETSDSGQKFHHQLDQMIQAAQDTPLPDDLRPQNPEALARTIMEQLPQKKGSIFAMFTNLFGGGQPKAKASQSKDSGRGKADKTDKKGAINRGGKKGKGKDPVEDDEVESPSDRRKPGVKFGRKDKEADISADEREDQMGTFSRLKSISSRANDAAENRDNQSTTRSLGEKFGMPGGATSNPLDEAPLTLAESIKRKVSESQKLSPLEMDSDDYSSQEMPATGGDFGRPQSQGQEVADADSSWSAPTPIGLPIKQKMGAPVTAQGLDWSGAPAGSPASSFEQHPGSAIGLAPPGQKPTTGSNPAAPSGGGLDWSSGTASTSNASSTQSGWGSNAPAMEPTAVPAKTDSGWGSSWGSENQAGVAPQNTGVPLKSSDSWAVPGSEAADAWGQPAAQAAPSPAAQAAVSQPAPVPPQNGQDPWGSAAVAGSGAANPSDGGGWSSPGSNAASSPASATEGDGGNWGQAASWGAPNTPVPNNTSNSLPSAAAPTAQAPAANDPWAQPAQPAAAAATDPWASAAAPAPTNNDPWAAASPAPAPAPTTNDPWAAASSAPAPTTNDPWAAASPAPAPTTNDPWAAASPAPAPTTNDPWSASAASAAPAAAPAVSDPWAAAAAAPQAIAAPATDSAWGAPAQSENKEQAPAAMGWGQSAAPQSSTEPAAWGAPAPSPAPAPAAPAIGANQSWSPEGEQMETGVWKSFTPKTGPLAPAAQAPAPAASTADRWDSPIQDRPKEAAPAAAAPVGASADRWDVPIQARSASAELPAPQAVSAVGSSGLPVNQIVEKMGSVLGGGAATDSRWDVPIQARSAAEMPAAAPPAAPAVNSSGIPVNQIVEKMGTVLGGPAAGADSRWDLPIQERSKETKAEPEQAPAPVQSFAQPAAPAAWGETPAASSTWGTHPEQPTTTPWGAVSAAPEPAQSPAAAPSGWGSEPAAPAAWAAPAAAPVAPAGTPSPTAWGTEAPTAAAPANSWDAAAAASPGWGSEPQPQAAPASAPDQWGQPPAWGQSQVPQAAAPTFAPAPVAAPEVTDKTAPSGMFNLGDQDIDKIFGDNLGVSEPVGRTLVNNGAEPQASASAPAQAPNLVPAAQPAQTNNFAPPQAAPSITAPAAAADPNAAKNGLFQLTDNDLDKLFSSNLGVDEPSTQVGVQATISPVQSAAAAPNNFAPPAAANSAPGWNTGAEQQAPSGWGVSAPTPSPVAAAGGANGWSGAPQAPSGWGMEQPPASGPSGWSNAPAAAPAEAQPSGWGSPTPPTPPAWNQPAAQAPAANVATSPEPAKGGLFSVDDNVMNRIFSDNLGIPEDATSKPDAYAIPDQGGEQVSPPKIAGIGRLDASGDQNQDAGSGRIASIGKFLLDQKDLDKIGKLTSSDLNEGKMRILTLEASQDLQSLLSQIGTQQGVIGSVIVGHDGLLIANTMPGDMDAESVGVWALGVYMNTEHVTKKMGHDRVHQVVSRTPRGYVVIADFGGGLLVTVTDGRDTDSLIPLMRTITQLVN